MYGRGRDKQTASFRNNKFDYKSIVAVTTSLGQSIPHDIKVYNHALWNSQMHGGNSNDRTLCQQ